LALAAIGLLACAPTHAPAPEPVAKRAGVSASTGPATSASDASFSPKPPAVSAAEAERVLFLGKTPPAVTAACASSIPAETRIACLIGQRYAADPAATKLALDLYAHAGDVAGVEPAQSFDGGYRGTIELVPELPIGRHRKHLAWVEEGTRDFDAVYVALERAAARRPLSPAYRWRALTLRFFRSVDRTTPNGFAGDWSYAYNVSGSLLHSAVAVRELMVHEIFHLNDGAHGEWSSRALAKIQADVIAKCGKSIDCLRPYAPHDTIVRGGTYYAFQPGNGPGEYAAELAVRHFREHRAVLNGEKLAAKPFKCGPAPNGEAWKLFVDELWAGVDLVPACR
jgi:hypothetical protein